MAEVDFTRATTRIDLGDEPPFYLGAMHVLPSELAVEMGGQRRDLQPRVMRVLVALARARPGVVSHDRLIDECWDGRVVGDDAINRCILVLRHLAGAFEPSPFLIETVPRVGHRLVQSAENGITSSPAGGRSRTTMAVATGAIIVALGATILLGGPGRWLAKRQSRVPVVLVMPAAGDAGSAALARELAIRLASLAQAEPVAIQLMGTAHESPSKADLVLQVGRSGDPAAPGANLLFMAPAHSTILWSKEFDTSSSSDSDLKQQIAVSSGRVISCAIDAMSGNNRPGDGDLKIYINACAALADSGADTRKIVSMLRGVLARQPRFASGWAKLLQAETAEYENDQLRSAEAAAALRRDISSERRYEPRLTEAYIAEYAITPAADFVARARILDTAIATNPGHAQARVERSNFFQSVGRLNDAVGDARIAVDLDPLSPQTRDAYILALEAANRIDAARAELAKAEGLWPGATSVLMARYRMDLRFGDPREALRLLRSGAIDTQGAKIQEAFLQARILPSEENVDNAVGLGRKALSFEPDAVDGQLQTLAEFGRKEELLGILLNWRRMDLVDLITDVLFRPAFGGLHRDPRFMRVADHLGLLTYWRTTGKWPDFCLASDLSYDCKAITGPRR